MKRSLKVTITLILALAFMFGNTMTALAEQVYDGQGNLRQWPDVRELSWLKEASGKNRTLRDNKGNVTIDVSYNDDGTQVSWNSNNPVIYVYVFGGDEGNLYDYASSGGAIFGTGEQPIGKKINHVTFYYHPQPSASALTIKYMQEGTTTELHAADRDVQTEGTTKTYYPVTVIGYEPIEQSHEHTFTSSDSEHIFWYKPVSTTLTVEYKLLEDGSRLADPDTFSGTFKAEQTVEAIPITGYSVQEPATHKHVFGVADAEYTFWYAPVQTTLTVKHLLDGTNNELRTQEVYTGSYGTEKTVTSAEITGHVLKEGEDSSYTHTFEFEDETYIFYYTKLEDMTTSTLIVKYMIQDTERELETPVRDTQTEGTTKTYYPVTVIGYEPIEQSHEHTFTSSDSEHIFWYKPVSTTLTVEYKLLEDGSRLADPDTFSGTFKAEQTVEAIPITGYSVQEPATHKHVFGVADAEYTFWYAPVQTTLTVKHLLDGTDNELRTQEVYTGSYGTEKTVTSAEITGHVLREGEDSSYTHTFGFEDETYIFYYTKLEDMTTSTLTVKYMIQDTERELETPVRDTQTEGTTKTYYPVTVIGYEPIEQSHEHTFTSSDSEHIFWYTPVQTTLTIRYKLIEDGRELADARTYYGTFGAKQEFGALSIIGYLVEGPVTYEHIFDATDMEFTFWYAPIETTLTVRHLLDGTDKELSTQEVYAGSYGTEKTVKSITLSGYVLKTGESSTYAHTFGDKNVVYIFWYVGKHSDTHRTYTLTVRYVLDGTGEKLADPTYYTRNEGGSATATAKAIPGYVLKEGQESSVKYVLNRDKEHVFVYVKETAPPEPVTYTLAVRYVLDGTDEELADPTYYEANEGESVTTAAKAISGYVLKEGQESSVTYVLDSDKEHVFAYVEEPGTEIIEDPDIPLAELPTTGGTAPEILYGIGILLTVTGFVIRRRRKF